MGNSYSHSSEVNKIDVTHIISSSPSLQEDTKIIEPYVYAPSTIYALKTDLVNYLFYFILFCR
jgi:hypothetical protein